MHVLSLENANHKLKPKAPYNGYWLLLQVIVVIGFEVLFWVPVFPDLNDIESIFETIFEFLLRIMLPTWQCQAICMRSIHVLTCTRGRSVMS